MNKQKQKLIAKFFSFIILFSSCSQYDNGSDYIVDEELSELNLGLSIDEYVDNHVNLTSEISEILKQENNIDVDLFIQNTQYVTGSKEFNKLLKQANFGHHNLLTSLYTSLNRNIQGLLSTYNSDFTESELSELITKKINEKFDSKEISLASRSGSCEETLRTKDQRCQRNYAIQLAGSIVGAFFTFGIAYIGAAAATLLLAKCELEAMNDFEECVSGQ